MMFPAAALAALFACAGGEEVAIPPAPATPEAAPVIVYTQAVDGEIEPCG